MELYNIWLSHLNCQHIRAIKAAQKQKCTVKTPHGAEQQELWDTRPPFLNQPFLWRPERREGWGVGGGKCSVKLKREREKERDKHCKMWWERKTEGWMDRWWMEGVEGVMKGCGRGHRGAWGWFLSSAVSDRLTVKGKQQQNLMKDTNTGGIFHCQWQPRPRSWLRGLNRLTKSQCGIAVKSFFYKQASNKSKPVE